MNKSVYKVSLSLLIIFAGWIHAQKPPTSVSAKNIYTIVSALISEQPRSLKQLEKVIGFLDRDVTNFAEAQFALHRQNVSASIEKVKVVFAIDIYHHDPREVVRDPSMASYEIWFSANKKTIRELKAIRDLLKQRLGFPKQLQKCGCLRFGDVYMTENPGSEGFTLAWYAREPEFAIPERTPEETDQLVAKVSAILQEGFSRETIEKHFGKLSYDPDRGEYVVIGETWKIRVEISQLSGIRWIRFEFKRPIPAENILRVLGVKNARVISTDVHMTNRMIVDFDKKDFPWAHRQKIQLHAEDSNLKSTKEHWPGSVVWQSPAYQITALETHSNP